MKANISLSFLTDMALAFVLLTRWPMPHLPQAAFAQGARAVWAYSLVGAALGVVGYVGVEVMAAAGLPAPLIAGLLLGFWMLSTGAMHEDGLADTADGFWGSQCKDTRLAIMKDSQIGTYGTLALIVTVGLRWIALSLLVSAAPLAVVACAALSRAAMPVVMLVMPSARENGLSHSVGRPAAVPVVLSFAIALVVALLTIGAMGVGAAVVVVLITAVVVTTARLKIGGQTGDVLGAAQQLSELSLLLFCASVLT